MKRYLVPLVLGALLVVPALAGCGGGSDSSGSPAEAAPQGTKLLIEATVTPSGELAANADAVAGKLAGIDDLGGFVIEKLEESATASQEEFDFDTEVRPWLGERAGIFFRRLEGSEPTDAGAALQTTDPGAAAEFLDEFVKTKGESEEATYRGVQYYVDSSDGSSIGVDGDFVLFGETKETFEAAVDAVEGDALADEDRYQLAAAGETDGSLADLYVDIGAAIEESEGEIDPQARQFLQSAGIDPSEATAVASLLPKQDAIEVELSSELAGEEPPSGDASALIESLPADSFAAIGLSGFGEQLGNAVDEIDESGIPNQVPPHQLKKGLMQVGIDLDKLAASIEDGAVFAEGSDRASLGGALVLSTAESGEAAKTVAGIGTILRASGTAGVTAVTGKASGFSVHSKDLGSKPLVVITKGDRIAIAYGLAAALRGVGSKGGETLGESAGFKAAAKSLGDTPISAYADGPASLGLAEALVPRGDQGFAEAKPYLRNIASLAIGGGADGDRATAKLVVSLKK